jgi:hypothetical protein
MDIRFLNVMAESYVNDSNHNLSTIEVEHFLIESITRFKRKYPSIMNSLYEKSRTYQQELIYSFLDTYFLELDEEHIDIESTIEENIFNNALKIVNDLKQSFKKSAGDNYTGYNTEEKLLLDVIIKNHDNCNRLCTGGKVIPNSVLMSLLYIQTNRPGESQKTADILSKVYNSSDINKFKSDIDFNSNYNFFTLSLTKE